MHFLVIDEVQDLTRLEFQFLDTLIGPATKVLAVGDRFQSIYQFRGASLDSMDILPESFSPANSFRLPLSCCYRCPTTHIILAQQLVGLAIEPQEIPKPGTIHYHSAVDVFPALEVGDLVLVSDNAKAIQYAFQCASQHNPIAISVYESVKMKMLATCAKCGDEAPIADVLKVLGDEGNSDMDKAKLGIAPNWPDFFRAKTYKEEFRSFVLCSGCETVAQLKHLIDNILYAIDQIPPPAGQDSPPEIEIDNRILFSTIHKAKGLGRRRVFWVTGEAPENITPGLRNVYYVAVTRAKEELHIIGDLPFPIQ